MKHVFFLYTYKSFLRSKQYFFNAALHILQFFHNVLKGVILTVLYFLYNLLEAMMLLIRACKKPKKRMITKPGLVNFLKSFII